MSTLRVLSYNVRSLHNSGREVAEVIRAVDPDVVCIQEAPRFLFNRFFRRRLARRAGMGIVTGGRAAGAMLLLARPSLRVVARRNVKLPWHPPLHRRGLALAAFDVRGVPVTVASGHFSLDDAERMGHLPQVLSELAKWGHPAVLGVDVNETPDGPVWQVLVTRYADAWAVAGSGSGDTYSAGNPHKRIDGVFVDRWLGVETCVVVGDPPVPTASDHRPVLTVVRTNPAVGESNRL